MKERPPLTSPEYASGQIVLKLEGGINRERLTRIVEPLGVQVKTEIANANLFVLDLPDTVDIPALSARLTRSEIVAVAEPNSIYKATASLPNDTFFNVQWGLDNTGQVILGSTGTPDADIDAPEAWDITTGAGAVVAIVDTGVDWGHPDLAANIWQNPGETGGGKETNGVDDDLNGKIDDFRGWDTVTATTASVAAGEDPSSPDNDPMDFEGHGTHVTGIAAAVIDNGTGVAGVSGDSQIMAVRAGFKSVHGNGSFFLIDIIAAMDYAVQNGADVINLSLGSSSPSSSLETACNDAVALGVTVVAASGNGGSTSVLYPAAHDSVIAVGATDNNDNIAAFSDHGPEIDVSAPGVDIGSTYPNNQYVYMNGTSMATPMVVGAVALLRSLQPAISPADIKAVLESTADDLGVPGRDDFFGHGRINAYAAAFSLLPVTSVDSSPTGAGGENGWFTINLAIALSVNETATTYYSWDSTSSISTYTVPINVPTQGLHNLYYFSIDQANNTETIKSREFKVDTDLPADRPSNESAWRTWKSATKTTSAYFTGKAGTTYYFRTYSLDNAGNKSWSKVYITIVPFNEGMSLLNRLGFNGYYASAQSQNYLSSVRYSYTRYNTLVYKLHNTSGVGLITTMGSNRGRAKIYIDGRYVKIVDAHSLQVKPRQLIFYTNFSKKGTHYLKIVNLGTPGRARFDVDAIAVKR